MQKIESITESVKTALNEAICLKSQLIQARDSWRLNHPDQDEDESPINYPLDDACELVTQLFYSMGSLHNLEEYLYRTEVVEAVKESEGVK